MDFVSVIIALIISGIFFVVLSMIIREVVELFKIEHNTFHKASEIAGIIALLAVLQFFVSTISWLSILISIFMLIVMYVLLKRFYGLSYKKALYILSAILLVFLVIIVVISLILLIIK